MKRITITLLSFFIFTGAAHAGIFNMGPRLGVSISQLGVDLDKGSQVYKDLNLKVGLGYQAGVFTRFSFTSLYVQPELLVSGMGANFNDKAKKEAQVRFTKLDLPVMVGLSFFSMVRAQVGPVFGLLLSALESDKSVEDHYSMMNFGWQAGLGVDIWNMVIDLKYEGNFSNFGDKIGKLNTKQGYGLWILSVGFNIF
ncbi:MAG: outer membrane beta-barrel protein [Bacteroidota bacterium]